MDTVSRLTDDVVSGSEYRGRTGYVENLGAFKNQQGDCSGRLNCKPLFLLLLFMSRPLFSIHYLLTDEAQPVIYGIVDESRTAYQAGSDAGWKNDRGLNNISIGIEIVNTGWVDGPDGRIWAPFPEKQIDLLIPLVKDIMARHHIAPENVLGHADVAPQRKQDPGALFPWKRLAAEGLVPWPEESVTASHRIEYGNALPDVAWFQRKLAEIGYVVPQGGQLDQPTRNVLIAFQTRYRPSKIDGEPDAETAALLDSPMRVRAPVTDSK